MKKFVFILLFLGSTHLSFSLSIPMDIAIRFIDSRLHQFERFVFLYTLSYPGSADGKSPGYKKLVLMGRDELKLSEKGDQTIRVQEELYWFRNSDYPEHAPIHSLGFSDGTHSYYWLSENNAAHQASPPNYLHECHPLDHDFYGTGKKRHERNNILIAMTP